MVRMRDRSASQSASRAFRFFQEALVISRTFLIAAAAVLAIAASPIHAQTPQSAPVDGMPGAVVTKVTTMQATVTDVDKATRMVTLQRDDGSEQTIKAGPEVRNFDQIEKGDRVNAEYLESVAIFARKAEATAGAATPKTATYGTADLAPLGQKPGGVVTDVTEVTTTVQDIDYAKRQVTVVGPSGKPRVINVSERVENLEAVKKGDQVIMRYTEALAISVTK